MMKKRGNMLLITALVVALVFSGTLTAFGAAGASTPASGIKVMYDGNYITFKDAAPKIINGRTMVPFRQILEDMGTIVTFDNATQTVLAKKGSTEFSFVIGGSDITIKENGITSVKKMDVVPYLDRSSNRTYVSARFMAESLGYGVGWDSASKVVVISDYEKLFANADDDFSILNKLITSEIDLEKTYHTTGLFSASFKMPAMTTDPASEPMEFGMRGSIDAIQFKTNADMVMKIAVDAEKAIAQLPADQQASAKTTLDMLKDMTIKMKMNGTDGIMFINTPIFSLLDPTVDANTWMKMDIFETYDEMGIDMKNIMSLSEEKSSVGMLLTQYALTAQTADADTYASVKAGYALFKNLMGDQAFVASTSGGTTTYTLDLTPVSVAAAIAKTAITEGTAMSLSDVSEVTKMMNQANFSGKLVIAVANDKMTSYSMTGDYSADGTDVGFDLNGTPLTADMTLSLSMEGIMDMDMSMSSDMKETTEKVDLTLPSGAKTIDYNSVMPN